MTCFLRLAMALLPLAISSCALAPAWVKEVGVRETRKAFKEPVEARLHRLLGSALEEGNTAGAKLALAEFVSVWKESGRPESATVHPPAGGAGESFAVQFVARGPGSYPLRYFNSIRPAARYEVKKLHHHQRQGLGAPLVAMRENLHTQPLENFYPQEGISRALTAWAVPGASRQGQREVSIQLLCPLVNETVVQKGRREPLAADLTVPWAAFLERTGKLRQSAILDMLTPDPRREPRLYLMEAYDPSKEPLIMIHGLLSTPLAWSELSNELWAVEGIRQRYQIWHYLYNTSAPALYSARILRNQLREVRALLDPEGDDVASRRTTLLTHSMGGLVGKALALEPGDAFWKAAFKVPPAQLKLSSEDMATLKDAFEWRADPTIHRIIFVATPHLGSSFADNFIGRAGSWLTGPPRPFRQFYERVSATNPGVFTPAYEELGRGKLDSVNSLSPRQPTLHILAGLRFGQHVRLHSIIGNRGKPGPLELSSDGIVPYTSSHLPQAHSEKVVPAGHGAFHHPEAVAEIQRLLMLP